MQLNGWQLKVEIKPSNLQRFIFASSSHPIQSNTYLAAANICNYSITLHIKIKMLLPQPPSVWLTSSLCMDAKFVFIFVLSLYGNMCINAIPIRYEIRATDETFSNRKNGNCSDHLRFVFSNTRLNTLNVSMKKCNKNMYLFLLILLYVTTFEFYFVIFLPN